MMTKLFVGLRLGLVRSIIRRHLFDRRKSIGIVVVLVVGVVGKGTFFVLCFLGEKRSF